MKRLIFLIWLLINSPLWANTKTVVIGDSTYFNYTHTTAIDSAQLILIRGTVKDTLSLMPITGSSHKICDWEGIFNQVDSAGNYNVWIEPYSSGAIADTILGDCLVELDSVLVDGSALAATAGAISDATLAASAINEIAAYPNYLFKCVVSGSPTTTVFQVSYISPTMTFVDNQFNGLRLVSIYSQGGGAQGQVNNIADFASADSTFTIRPGMTTSVNSGDTVLVLPQRMAVEPVVLTNHAIATDGSGYVSVGVITSGAITAAALHGEAADEIAESTYTFTSGTNRLAREEDSTAFQGAAAGVDSTLISNLIHRIVWGTAVGSGSDSSTAAQRDITSARIDSILVALGFDAGGGTDLKSVHAKMGMEWLASDPTMYSGNYKADSILSSLGRYADTTITAKMGALDGTAGSNVKDNLDTLLVHIGGRGENACSIYVKSGAVYPANMSVVMFASGGTSYSLDTDANGLALFSLDDGTYTGLLASAPTYVQDTIPQTFTFTAAYNDTITATATSIGAAGGGANFCSVYVYTYDILGDSIQGAVFTITPRGRGPWIDTNNVVIIPLPKRTTTNVNGYAGLAVYRSSVVRELQSDGTAGGDSLKYDIQLTYRSKKWRADNRVVPNSGSWGAK